MLHPSKPRYDNWLLSDEPRTRIVASNRHRRRHATRPPVAAAPATVTFARPADERKPSLFQRAASFMRRVIGG